ncbi:GTA-gp10 family protein [Novosphingobium olei]|uniref:GTA-gp10 family protein n=1 Tax=Novosphingobium olei TaxID=2728851 RepID=UPI0030CC7742
MPFADGNYDFWLPMSRVVAFEREAESSIFALFYAIGDSLGQAVDGAKVLIGASDARLKQCHSLIRNGLIGGGASEQQARELVEVYCYPARPAMHDMALAWEVLSAAIYGVKVDGSKKKRKPTAKPVREGRGAGELR